MLKVHGQIKEITKGSEAYETNVDGIHWWGWTGEGDQPTGS